MRKAQISISFIENAPLLVIAGIYVSSVYLITKIYNLKKYFVLDDYHEFTAPFAIFFLLFFFALNIILKSHKRYLNIRYIFGYLLIIPSMAFFSSSFASMKQSINFIHDFSWDTKLMEVDRIIHFGIDPYKFFLPLFDYPSVIQVIDVLYVLWVPLLIFFCFLFAISEERKLRLQFFISLALCWIIMGSLMALFFLSAGPCYYSFAVNSPINPYELLMSKLHHINDSYSLLALRNQQLLLESYINMQWLPFGGISAMPSLHVSISTLLALVARELNKSLSIFFIAYAMIIQIGSVILAWHYAIDGYVAIITTITIWKLSALMINRYSSLMATKVQSSHMKSLWARSL